MDAVHERVVDLDGEGHEETAALREEAAPGDAGNRVAGRKVHRMAERRERDPRDAGEVEKVVPAGLVLEGGAHLGPRDGPLGGRGEGRKVLRVGDEAEAEEVALREHGERRVDDRVLDHVVPADPLAKLGKGVRRGRKRVDERDGEREPALLRPPAEAGDVDVRAEARVGEVHRAEELEVAAPGPGCLVDRVHGLVRDDTARAPGVPAPARESSAGSFLSIPPAGTGGRGKEEPRAALARGSSFSLKPGPTSC